MAICCYEYELKLFSRDGNFLLAIPDALRIQAARVENDAGSFEIVLPPSYPPRLFVGDNIFEIWRSVDGNVFNLLGNTCWFIRRIRVGVDDDGVETTIVSGHDTTGLLDRRVVAWYGSDVAGFHGPGSKQAPAGQIIHELFTENFGVDVAGIDTNGTANDEITEPPVGVANPIGFTPVGSYTVDQRRMRRPAHTTIVSNLLADVSPIVTIQATFQNVLAVMKQVASSSEALGTPLVFDIDYTPAIGTLGTFEFNTYVDYRGNDRRNSVVLGPDFGTMGATAIELDYTNVVTNSYVGGAGTGTARLIAGAVNQELLELSPFHPVESFVEATELTNQDHLIERAIVELNGFALRPTIEGTVIQTETMAFEREYFYGDIVSAQWRSLRIPVKIYSFSVTIEDGCEEADIGVETFNDGEFVCVGSTCYVDPETIDAELINPVALGYDPTLQTLQTFTNVNGSGVDVSIQRQGPGTGSIVANTFRVAGIPGDLVADFYDFYFSRPVCGRMDVFIDSDNEPVGTFGELFATKEGGRLVFGPNTASGLDQAVITPTGDPLITKIEQLDPNNEATAMSHFQGISRLTVFMPQGEMQIVIRMDPECDYTYVHECAGDFTRYDRFGIELPGEKPLILGNWVALPTCSMAPAGVWADRALLSGADETILNEDQQDCPI
jgi:hypothetical protein